MMDGSIRAALVVAGAMTLLGASRTEAQHPLPRVGGVAIQPRAPRPVGRAADAPPRQVPDPRFPPSATDPRSPLALNDPRFPRSGNDPRFNRPAGTWDARRQRRPPQSGGSTVIIVPVPGDYYGYGYGSGYAQRGYYTRGYEGVYDVSGRPLSTSLEPEYTTEAPGYTPDLGGSPYRVTNEGLMVVDFASRERRAFPSCAGQTAVRDPDGRPRTIFYQPTDYWMVLRPGQRGRVHGAPPSGAAACYAIDSVGNVVLRY
ncbi:MAG: hypothetical protein ABI601_05010 [bacterium]